LQACIDTHTECRAFTTGDGDPFIPARLLELSGLSHAPSVRLRSSSSLMPMSPSSASPPPSYAILSYCWGGDQPSKLLSSRLVAYHRSIDRDTLPAAVLDACHVAARLGFNYLWVDALCIIQDDPHDKMLQIGQMHRIFRGAALTIAAETSPSATQGFLHPRADHQPSLIRISAGSDHHENTVVLVPRAYYPSRTETLHTRGWTFQETHLSARIVAYGAREPVFHCIASRLADGGAAPTLQDTASLSSFASLLDPGSAIMLGSPGSRPQHPYDWIAIINAYRARHLTVDEDRLPGIAALAEEYATRAGLQGLTDYLAGMWRTDLLAQCLWACDNGLDGPMQRLPEYIAPSWSWASMPPLKSPWYSGPEDIDQWTWSTVLDAHTTLCQPQDTPYAAVSDGLLRVR
ncbi:heterokaryon incompatibility protein-domain-containing protein, partial [Plectosphaerella cucumerina]